MISLRASAKKIAEANSKIIERLRQLFAEAKIVEFRGLFNLKADFQSSHEAPRSSLRVHA